uniref:Uncharacterized protein n=1 Tax=Ananas comosus var. bracteatus TaxID=296719 RepID=A0A6V7PVB6_ANACO|nr:unnamed protein product [Ananas comosus var. bracteatus]
MVNSVATSLSFSLLLICAFVVADTNVNVKPLFDVVAALNNPPELIKSWKGDNPLQGSIPDSLTTLSSLQLLDVTNNDLSGKVPRFALNVTLKLSGNHFDP